MKRKSGLISFIVAISLIMFLGNYEGAQGYCDPQCVPWARDHSKVKLHAPTARDLPAAAQRDSNYVITPTPKKGNIMVLNTKNSEGHVIAIQDSDKKDNGKYSLRITHSNYNYKSSGKCDTESNVKATYNKNSDTIKFKSGVWDGKEFKVIAIIRKK